MMHKKLSIKQKQVLECIEWYIDEYGYSPTYREIATILGKGSTKSIFNIMFLLEQKGYIKTDKNKARSIKIIRRLEDEVI